MTEVCHLTVVFFFFKPFLVLFASWYYIFAKKIVKGDETKTLFLYVLNKTESLTNLSVYFIIIIDANI